MPKDKVKINVKDRLDENVLDLSLSEIEYIPVKEIASLKRATQVDLSSNNIKFLPKSFGSQLTHLTRLDLSKNELKFLSDDFGNLINLKHLDLYNNHLENLPLTFGDLAKLRYLDLKGNSLQPALLKVVGPCLTGKDCMDAAKNVVPFMKDVAASVRAEQERKRKQEEKQKEVEALKTREEARLAKKAARKERVMRERLEKAEAEKQKQEVTPEPDEPVKSTQKAVHHKKNAIKVEPSKSTLSTGISSFLTTFLSVIILLIFIFVLFLKFLPEHGEKMLNLLPTSQQSILRSIYATVDRTIFKTFNKVLNFHKI